MIFQGTPVEMCAQIIERYIYTLKGVHIQIQLPIEPEYEEKFILALVIASAYFNIDI